MKKALEAFLASGERLAELAGKTLHIDLGVVTDAVIVLLLERGGQVQLVYKHAVSTMQPGHPLNLTGEGQAEEEG